MTQDAAFEDGREIPLNIGAMDAEDLKILASLSQDAVFPVTEIKWQAAKRRFAILLNRFRWEDQSAAQKRGRKPERVQSLLLVENVLGVASQGIDRSDKDMIFSLLDVEWTEGEDAAGIVTLLLAGDGAIRLQVEALELGLRDVTRPYIAPSGKVPDHDT